MSFFKRLFGFEKREPNFAFKRNGRTIDLYVPLAEEVDKVQIDYIQKIKALGRANANSRRNLAANTLLNVHRKGL